MARKPRRTKYQAGGPADHYRQEGGKLTHAEKIGLEKGIGKGKKFKKYQEASEGRAPTNPNPWQTTKMQEGGETPVRRESKFAQYAPFMDWIKPTGRGKGKSVSPRPIYEPTTKTWFPRLAEFGKDVAATFRGEGDSMAMTWEDGGPVERSTRNQGNQSLMGGNVEQHD